MNYVRFSETFLKTKICKKKMFCLHKYLEAENATRNYDKKKKKY